MWLTLARRMQSAIRCGMGAGRVRQGQGTGDRGAPQVPDTAAQTQARPRGPNVKGGPATPLALLVALSGRATGLEPRAASFADSAVSSETLQTFNHGGKRVDWLDLHMCCGGGGGVSHLATAHSSLDLLLLT